MRGRLEFRAVSKYLSRSKLTDLDNDFDIEPERPVVDIVEVDFNPPLHISIVSVWQIRPLLLAKPIVLYRAFSNVNGHS